MSLGSNSTSAPLKDTKISSNSTLATTSSSNQSGSNDFVKKLFLMLQEDNYKDIVRWTAQGDSFVVINTNVFTKEILPRHFKHSNFASFVRQLNKYDFHKVKISNEEKQTYPYGDDAWEFKHPNFKIHDRESLENIRRKGPATKKSAIAATGAATGAASSIDNGSKIAGQGHKKSHSLTDINLDETRNLAEEAKKISQTIAQITQLNHTVNQLKDQIEHLKESNQHTVQENLVLQKKYKTLVDHIVTINSFNERYYRSMTTLANVLLQSGIKVPPLDFPPPNSIGGSNISGIGIGVGGGNGGGGPVFPHEQSPSSQNNPFPNSMPATSLPSISQHLLLQSPRIPPHLQSPLVQPPFLQPPGINNNHNNNNNNNHGHHHNNHHNNNINNNNNQAFHPLQQQLPPPPPPLHMVPSPHAPAQQALFGANRALSIPSGRPPPNYNAAVTSPISGLANLSRLLSIAQPNSGFIPAKTTNQALDQNRDGISPRQDGDAVYKGLNGARHLASQPQNHPPSSSSTNPAASATTNTSAPNEFVQASPANKPLSPLTSTSSSPNNNILPQISTTSIPNPKFHVLLVEDDNVCIQLCRKFLVKYGCQVTVVTDGLNAISTVEHTKYDLVLMDIVMPNLDGATATSVIRSFDTKTPIIAMTGNIEDNDLVTYLQNGMSDILAKPFTKDDLYSILSKHLLKEEQQAPAPAQAQAQAHPHPQTSEDGSVIKKQRIE
ncbi:response regulator [Acetobacter pasteurianus]|nr:response regulator [Acetobacter pasteurianus]